MSCNPVSWVRCDTVLINKTRLDSGNILKMLEKQNSQISDRSRSYRWLGRFAPTIISNITNKACGF